MQKIDEDTGESIYQVSGNEELVIKPDALMGMKLAKDRGEVDAAKEVYVIDYPRPGAWRFTVEGLTDEECRSRYEARMRENVSSIELASPIKGAVYQVYKNAPNLDPDNLIPFKLVMRSESNEPIIQEKYFPLEITLTVTITDKNGNVTNLEPVELENTEAGVWSNFTQGLQTPLEGDYSISVVGRAPSGDRTQKVTIFDLPRLGMISAKELDTFSYAITKPADELDLACNQVVNGQKESMPVEVMAQIYDETGATAEANRFMMAGSEGPVFQAQAYDADGQPIGKLVDMLPETEGGAKGLYRVKLLPKDGPLSCGDTRIEVRMVGQVDNTRFASPGFSHSVKIKRVEANGVVVEPITPTAADSFALHGSIGAGCAAAFGAANSATPVTLEFRLKDLDGKVLDPNKLAKNNDNLAKLFKVRLVSPDSKVFEDLVPYAEERGDEVHLFAQGGQTLAAEGEYYFSITPNQEIFVANYAIPDEPLKVTFNRKDSALTKPANCQQASMLGLILLLLLAGFLAWGLTGGPGGVLEINQCYPTNTNVFTRRLSRFRLHLDLSNQTLLGMGIKKIKYSRAKTPGTGVKAAWLRVINNDSLVAWEGQLELGETMPLIDDYEVTYRG